MSSVQVSVRASAVCIGVSGLVVAAATPWHPPIFEGEVADVVRDFEAWTVLHAASAPVVVLAFIGAAGLVAVHEGRLGRLGQAGLIAVLLGVVGVVGVVAVEAITFPVLAVREPGLIALDGPLFSSGVFLGLGLLGLGWPLGLAILGVAAARTRDFPTAAGVLLAVSGPAFLVLAGPFVPVAGPLSAVVFGLSQVWWGWLMWRPAAAPHAVPA